MNKDKSPQLQDLVLNDVAPLSIGMSDVKGVMNVFIKRNSKIPLEVTQNDWVNLENQETASIEVYEGERAMVQDNVLLGKFLLEGVPRRKAGEVKFKFTFKVDKDGISLD